MTIMLNPDYLFLEELSKCSRSKEYFAQKYFKEHLEENQPRFDNMNSSKTQALLIWHIIFQSDKTLVYLATNQYQAKTYIDTLLEKYHKLNLPDVIVKRNFNQARFANNNMLIAVSDANHLRGRTIDTIIADELCDSSLERASHTTGPYTNIVRVVR